MSDERSSWRDVPWYWWPLFAVAVVFVMLVQAPGWAIENATRRLFGDAAAFWVKLLWPLILVLLILPLLVWLLIRAAQLPPKT